MPGEAVAYRRRQAGRGARQGDHRHEHHRPRLPGLPPGRQLPDPPAVADRREVRRLPADPAAGARLAAAAAAEEDPRRRARRRPVPAAARQQRHQRRPGPDQRHQHAALRAALPPDLQRTRRRPRRPRRRPRGAGQTRQPGAARRRHASSASSPASATSSPSWPATPTTILGPLARERAHVAGFLANAGAAAAGQLRTRRRTGSVAAEVPPLPARVPPDDGAACRASPTPPRRSSKTSATRRRR